VGGVHVLLSWLGGWPLALVWGGAMLYLTLGFRQFSHHFTGIRDALEMGDEERARSLLAQWQYVDASAVPRSEIVRHVIEYSVLAAHRHVFGVLAWFCIGALLGLGPQEHALCCVSLGTVLARKGARVRPQPPDYWQDLAPQPGPRHDT